MDVINNILEDSNTAGWDSFSEVIKLCATSEASTLREEEEKASLERTDYT